MELWDIIIINVILDKFYIVKHNYGTNVLNVKMDINWNSINKIVYQNVMIIINWILRYVMMIIMFNLMVVINVNQVVN